MVLPTAVTAGESEEFDLKDIAWNLGSVYPSSESAAYRADKEVLVSLSATVLSLLKQAESGELEASDWLPRALESLNRLLDLSENLGSYVYAAWSVDTSNEAAQGEMDDLEERSLALKDVLVRFRSMLPGVKFESLPDYRFWLDEQVFLSKRQMSPEEEALAADLQRCGGDAWDRLHSRLSSSLNRPWDDSEKTVTQLRSLAFDADRNVRKRAWEEECAAWKGAEVSFAAALNGVKGTTVTLNTRRGWGSTLEKSLVQNRLSRTALDAMLGVMTESLPLFRRYFRAKAKMLGLPGLAWYDLFAPIKPGDTKSAGEIWSWERVSRFIPEMFDTLSIEMGDFARRAFSEGWIDASPRNGKVGGAYCTNLPLAGNGGESRILCNFDGSFDSVSTVAHELGHAWHGEVMKNLPAINREYPMTLAETASIFSETLVFRAALDRSPESSKPGIIDTYLVGASQVIVDILSRFHFESALMRYRPDGELSPAELSEIMLDAQNRTYGDALEESERHQWMWAVKGHYYSPDLAFYNFPYAFGQLFALGLYARFRKEGGDFAPRYRELLRLTGSADAVSVGKSAGFNIESPDFWHSGISTIKGFIEEFEKF